MKQIPATTITSGRMVLSGGQVDVGRVGPPLLPPPMSVHGGWSREEIWTGQSPSGYSVNPSTAMLLPLWIHRSIHDRADIVNAAGLVVTRIPRSVTLPLSWLQNVRLALMIVAFTPLQLCWILDHTTVNKLRGDKLLTSESQSVTPLSKSWIGTPIYK